MRRFKTLIIVTMILINGLVVFIPFTDNVKADYENWWDTDWDCYVPLAINNNYIDEDLSNFPVLVVINSTIGAKCDGGNSIRFIPDSNSSMEYPYQIDEWNEGGNSFVWVNITHVESSSYNTQFNMYYSNSGASDNSSTDTWDSNYVFVGHMNTSTTQTNGCYDSSPNSNHGTFVGTVPNSMGGMVGTGQSFDNDGDYITLPSGTFTDLAGTFECYIKANDTEETDYLHQAYQDDSNRHWTILDSGGTYSFAYYKDAGFEATFTSGDRGTNYTYVASAFQEYDAELYVNDTTIFSGLAMQPADWSFAASTLAAKYDGNNEYSGMLDEVRISNIRRDRNWTNATYKTIYYNDTFISFGAEETLSGNNNPTTSGESPVDDATGTPYTPVNLYVVLTDSDGDTMNASWWSNSSGTWKQFGVGHSNVASATNISTVGTNFTSPLTTYTWSINVTDGEGGYRNSTYVFTTMDYNLSINITDTSFNGSRNITWAGDVGTSVWSNSSGFKGETLDINITIPGADDAVNYSDIRIYVDNIDSSLTSDCINLTFSSDNITWAGDDNTVNGTQCIYGGGYIYINYSRWSDENGMYGSNPFTDEQGLPKGWTNIYMRAKLDIPNNLGDTSYSTGFDDWKAELMKTTNTVGEANKFNWIEIYQNTTNAIDRVVSLTTSGNYLYVSAHRSYNFTIFDISDKYNIVERGYFTVVGSKPRECSISDDGNWAFLSTDVPPGSVGGSLTIIDISDKDNPTQEGNITFGDAHIEGAYYVDDTDVCYLADYDNDVLRAIDVSDKANPVELDNIAAGDQPHAVWANDTIACIVNYGDDELRVFNVEDPENIVQKDVISSGSGNPAQVTVHEGNNLCFVGNLGGSCNIFDISDPTDISQEASITSGIVQCVDALPSNNGTQLFVTSIASGSPYLATHYVYDITSPSSPVLSNSITGSNETFYGPQATGTALSGRYFYTSAWYSSIAEGGSGDTLTVFQFGSTTGLTTTGKYSSFGGEVTTSGTYDDITVTTSSATGVEETNATLNGVLNDDGGEECTVRFEYGTTTSYGTNTSNQTKSLGESFTDGISGLSKGQIYHYRAYANNSENETVGSDVSFLTKPDNPTGISCTTNNASSINLTWTKGTGANNTYIERNTIQNWERGSGTIAYNGTGISYNDDDLDAGQLYFYQAWSYTKWDSLHQFSDLNISDYELTKPEACTNLQMDFLNTTTVNITWTKGTGANNTLIVMKQTGLPSSISDGTVLYNGTGEYVHYTIVIGESYYFKSWSYANWTFNPHLYYYSENTTTLETGGLYVNVFDEQTLEALTFDIKVSNEDGSDVYENNDCTNTLSIDVDLCPLGEDIQIIIDADGYYQRVYTMDLYADILNVLYAYLPVEETNGTGGGSGAGGGGSGGGGGTGDNCVIRSFIDSATVTDPDTNKIIDLTYVMDDLQTVEIYNKSLYPDTYSLQTYIDSITVSNPDMDQEIALTKTLDELNYVELYNRSLYPDTITTKTFTDSKTVTDHTKNIVVNLTNELDDMISVELYNKSLYVTYGGWIQIPNDKFSYNTTNTTISNLALDKNSTMVRVNYYYLDYTAESGGWMFIPSSYITYNTTNVTINESIVDSNTQIIRVNYNYLDYSAETGGWIQVPNDKITFNSTSVTILSTAMDENTVMARVNYYYEDCGMVDVSFLYNLRVVETITTDYTSYDKSVEGALMTIKKYINTTGVYTSVTSLYTDANGYINVYLIPGDDYKVFITKTGYNETISSYLPNPPNQYGQTAEKVFRLVKIAEEFPDTWIEDVHTNITWSYYPISTLHRNTFNFWYNITSSDCQLQWYRLEVYFYNSTLYSWVLLDEQNESNACGGNLNYSIPNITGKYAFKCFYKKIGYDEYEIGEIGSIIQFYSLIKQGLESVPDYAWFLITIIVMLVGIGFFTYYFGVNVLTGYIGLGIMALMLLFKDFTINVGDTSFPGWVIWTITFLLYTAGWFLWSRL